MVDSPKSQDGKQEPPEATEVTSNIDTPVSNETSGKKAEASAPKKDGAASSVPHPAVPQKAGAVARSKDAGAREADRPDAGAWTEVSAPSPSSSTGAVKAVPLKAAAVSGGTDKQPGRAKVTPPEPDISEPRSKQNVPSINELKEKIMASNPTEYTEKIASSMTETANDMQERSKAAYDKSSEVMAEMSDFAKGTAEAMVESTKIMAGAMQDMGKSYADEAKTAYEQMTTDLKEMAAVKSPTELFQLQGKIMRRNFDALVSTTSKNAEMMMKLSNEAFAPVSARMNVAAEKMGKIS